jgi:hypothetical protein
MYSSSVLNVDKNNTTDKLQVFNFQTCYSGFFQLAWKL